jgi:RNA polymerase sigma-70 factor (ECF subfamily)
MDSDLVTRAQLGDRSAFETLAKHHYARLQKAAIGILRDRHAAEDATQQALLNIWRDLRHLRDPLRFEGWSYRLLVRACYTEARRRPAWLLEPSARPTDEPMASDAYDVVIERDQLERGFQRLSVDHRAVVVLHHLMDLPVEQVAEALDIPVGTVKSRLSRAMDGLRSAIEADDRVPPSRAVRQEVVR